MNVNRSALNYNFPDICSLFYICPPECSIYYIRAGYYLLNLA